jgi:hypothetical protein
MTYSQPVVLEVEDFAEGVYMASGGGCYSVDAYITQTPETGRGDYRIQVNAHHHAEHSTSHQTLYLVFNLPVELVSSGGTPTATSGNTISISYSYFNNADDSIGLADIVVTADAGLSISNAYMVDNDNA